MMEIVEVSDVDLAFPANGWKMLPDRKLVEKFKKTDVYKKWSELFTQLFFGGTPDGKELKLVPREGVDAAKAWRMIQCAMGTFGCKHEHKHEGVSYMLDQFFKDYYWESDEAKKA